MKYTYLLFLIFLSNLLFSQHTLVLSNGEKVNGVVISLNEDQWVVVVDGKEENIHMKEVSSVFFQEYVPYDGSLIPEGQEKTLIVNGFTVKYKIKDRSLEREPKVSIGTQDKGIVVVDITVDRYGNVKTAEPGAPGSTTSNNYLYTKAMTAAKSAKFDENLKGPIITEGTITVVYE